MEPIWNGILTCDYERTRPNGSLLEWELYTRSLISWPQILMDDSSPYGRLRRAGIVDIPETDHARITCAWHARLAVPRYVAELIALTTRDQNAAATALDLCDNARHSGDAVAWTSALASATNELIRVNATHIVNWLLPEERWTTLLTGLFDSRTKAEACMVALQLPAEPSHVLAAHQVLLDAASTSDPTQAAEHVAATGHLYGSHPPATTATPYEDPDGATVLIATIDPAEAATTSRRMAAHRTTAVSRRDAWQTAAILAAAGDDRAVTEVQAMAAALGWAATCEERRKPLRDRYLATVRRWCATYDLDPARITLDDLAKVT
ncbi:hypothetical protein E1287_27330 [Actinomadura sp. KC06]|uniref:hypothetical protein n=1 Tax=Actinomadura sp. KC06 TaxID=2530369 RepID=UPI00104BDDFA|nr:hypothetical protein [Actinomadura sp. KC06]TDD31229.1 hypothetical protein E1287_27330 [Actinomadura sp. KC06]